MKSNKFLVIGVVMFVALMASSACYAQSEINYKSTQIGQNFAIEIPDSTVNEYANGISKYVSNSGNTFVNVYDSQKDVDNKGLENFTASNADLFKDSTNATVYKNYQINKTTINGTQFYIVSVNGTVSFTMGSTDLNVVEHMIDSLGSNDKAVSNSGNAKTSAASGSDSSSKDSSASNTKNSAGSTSQSKSGQSDSHSSEPSKSKSTQVKSTPAVSDSYDQEDVRPMFTYYI